MPTRRQNPEVRIFNQSAFASSAEYGRGILANLAADRCNELTDREEITMHWWLQQVSWREGGMEKFASDLVKSNEVLIGTPTMHKIGKRVGQTYSTDQVKAVRREIGSNNEGECTFPLRGEYGETEFSDYLDDDRYASENAEKRANFPTSYPASVFAQACKEEASRLHDALKQALVDPAANSLKSGLWYFPNLWAVLCASRQHEIDCASGHIVETAVTKKVFETIDFAHESRSFTLIEGREGIGKSVAARSWHDLHPGSAVYVSLSSGTDEMSLFRSIARALGTAYSISLKAGEIKARIEEALLPGHLTLILDEAHFLWPQSERAQRSAPKRVDWLRTALIDAGVPVVLISTPQYFSRQCDRFRKGGWNSNQIQRRLAHTVCLPEALEKKDALALARYYFPDSSAGEAAKVGVVSALTTGYLTTMEHLRKRVDFFKSRNASEQSSTLLARAIEEVCNQNDITLDAPSNGPASTLQPRSNALSRPQHLPEKDGLNESIRSPASLPISRIQSNEALLSTT